MCWLLIPIVEETFRYTLRRTGVFCQQLDQQVEINRLGEDFHDPRFGSLFDEHRKAGEEDARELRVQLPHLAKQRDSIHVGQMVIDDCQCEGFLGNVLKCTGAVMGNFGMLAAGPQKLGCGGARVGIVVHQENGK